MKNKSNKMKAFIVVILVVAIVGFMIAPTFAQHSITMDSFFGNIFGIFTPTKEFSPQAAILWLEEQLSLEESTAYDYFDPRAKGNSLDSTGPNWAPEINADMLKEESLNMKQDEKFGWRIWKGDASVGYNIFWTTNDLPKTKVGEALKIIRYNTVEKKMIYGTALATSKMVKTIAGDEVNIIIIDGGTFVDDDGSVATISVKYLPDYLGNDEHIDLVVPQKCAFSLLGSSVVREGYKQVGWRMGKSSKLAFNKVINTSTKDIVLYALWEEVSPPATVTISYLPNYSEATEHLDDQVPQQSKFNLREESFVREGYKQIGWYNDSFGNVEFGKEISVTQEGYTFYAVWEKLEDEASE